MKRLLAMLAVVVVAGCASLNSQIGKVEQSTVAILYNNEIGCSGFAIEPTVIVTAYHCLLMGTDAEYQLKTFKGEIITARVTKGSLDLDLAILTIEVGLPPLQINEELTKKGDPVLVVGMPYGVLEWAATTGKIVLPYWTGPMGDRIVIDAAVAGGNSGGPVTNAYGEVIGVLVQGSGIINLAVPIKKLKEL